MRQQSTAAPVSLPWYLYGVFGGLSLGAGGGAFYWWLSCEPGFREFVEGYCPWLVEIIRVRIGFSDEDLEERRYRLKLQREIFSEPATVRGPSGAATTIDPRKTMTEACEALQQKHHLALRVDDLPLLEEDDVVFEESTTALEKDLGNLGAPSFWAATVPSQLPDKAALLRDLDQRTEALATELNSGIRQVDDVTQELIAIDKKRQELQGRRGSFFSRFFFS